MKNLLKTHIIILGLLLFLFNGIYSHPIPKDAILGENSDNFIPFGTGSVIIVSAVFICTITLVVGCLCCQRSVFKRRDTIGVFDSVHNGPVHDGYVNANLGTEFTIFPPRGSAIDERGSLNDVKFEPLPDIRPRGHSSSGTLRPRPASFCTVINRGLPVEDWFEDPSSNFPRNQLQYLQELGSGWFGQVVEGEAQGISRNSKKNKVVVKILRDDATPTDQIYFLHEVRAFRDLDHPNVMKLLGKCLETDPFLIILEHCAFKDLKTYLIQHRTESESLIQGNILLRTICNIAAGLSHMHKNGFVHTDLAARNCLVTNDLQVKIGDYGNSIEKFKDDYYCATDMAVPIRWCAPESLRCTETSIEPREVTPESNIWSFGVVTWEILEFAKLPYTKLNEEEVLQRVVIERGLTLSQPLTASAHKDKIFQVMQLCWLTDPKLRPNMDKIHTLLVHLHTHCNTTNKTISDFEARWNALQPRTNPRLVNMTNQISASGDSAVQTFETDFGDPPPPSSPHPSAFSFDFPSSPASNLSPSLQNLRGSLDDLAAPRARGPLSEQTSQSDTNLSDASPGPRPGPKLRSSSIDLPSRVSGRLVQREFDQWLAAERSKGDEQYKMAREISDAIVTLDAALADENCTDSESNRTSPEREAPSPEQLDSLAPVAELVKEKSASVQDFLKLIVIESDNSEEDANEGASTRCLAVADDATDNDFTNDRLTECDSCFELTNNTCASEIDVESTLLNFRSELERSWSGDGDGDGGLTSTPVREDVADGSSGWWTAESGSGVGFVTAIGDECRGESGVLVEDFVETEDEEMVGKVENLRKNQEKQEEMVEKQENLVGKVENLPKNQEKQEEMVEKVRSSVEKPENLVGKVENLPEKQEDTVDKVRNSVENPENLVGKVENLTKNQENQEEMVEKVRNLVEKQENLFVKQEKLEHLGVKEEELVAEDEEMVGKVENLVGKQENLVLREEIVGSGTNFVEKAEELGAAVGGMVEKICDEDLVERDDCFVEKVEDLSKKEESLVEKWENLSLRGDDDDVEKGRSLAEKEEDLELNLVVKEKKLMEACEDLADVRLDLAELVEDDGLVEKERGLKEILVEKAEEIGGKENLVALLQGEEVLKEDYFHQKEEDLLEIEAFHRNKEDFHQKEEDFHQKEADFHQKEEDLLEIEDFHQNKDNFHQKEEDFHQKEADFHQKEADFHQKEEDLHKKEEDYLQKEDFQQNKQDFHQNKEGFYQKEDDFHKIKEDLHPKEEDLLQNKDLHPKEEDLLQNKDLHPKEEDLLQNKDFHRKEEDFQQKEVDFQQKKEDFQQNKQDFHRNKEGFYQEEEKSHQKDEFYQKEEDLLEDEEAQLQKEDLLENEESHQKKEDLLENKESHQKEEGLIRKEGNFHHKDEFHQKEEDFHQKQEDFHQKDKDFHQNDKDFHQKEDNLHRKDEYHQKEEDLFQKDFHQNTEPFHQKAENPTENDEAKDLSKNWEILFDKEPDSTAFLENDYNTPKQDNCLDLDENLNPDDQIIHEAVNSFVMISGQLAPLANEEDSSSGSTMYDVDDIDQALLDLDDPSSEELDASEPLSEALHSSLSEPAAKFAGLELKFVSEDAQPPEAAQDEDEDTLDIVEADSPPTADSENDREKIDLTQDEEDDEVLVVDTETNEILMYQNDKLPVSYTYQAFSDLAPKTVWEEDSLNATANGSAAGAEHVRTAVDETLDISWDEINGSTASTSDSGKSIFMWPGSSDEDDDGQIEGFRAMELELPRPMAPEPNYSPDWESESESNSEESSSSSTSGEFDCSKSLEVTAAESGCADHVIVKTNGKSDEEQLLPSVRVSTWDKHATPKRSSLKLSPEKKSSDKKSVSFEIAQNPFVYEYPKEKRWSEPLARGTWTLPPFEPKQHINFTDWEMSPDDICEDFVEVDDFDDAANATSTPVFKLNDELLYRLSDVPLEDMDAEDTDQVAFVDPLVGPITYRELLEHYRSSRFYPPPYDEAVEDDPWLTASNDFFYSPAQSDDNAEESKQAQDQEVDTSKVEDKQTETQGAMNVQRNENLNSDDCVLNNNNLVSTCADRKEKSCNQELLI